MWLFALDMTCTHCEVYWDLDFEPSENQWRTANGIWGVRCLAWSDCQGPECWLEGHGPLGLPYSAAWHHIVTLCKFWEWLTVIFRIQRSSLIMPKPLMRSHCKAMCYRKLANCFGRVTAGVDINAASNVLAMVLPLCLQRSEGDGTCLLPVGWNLDDC